MSINIDNIPLVNDSGDRLNMTADEFGEATKDIAELFKKIKELNIWESINTVDNDKLHEKTLEIWQDLFKTFQKKYSIGMLIWASEDLLCKRIKIISLKMKILDDMILRYCECIEDRIDSKYIDPDTERMICDIMINDKTGYLKCKKYIQKIMKQILKHESYFRTEKLYRHDLFPQESTNGRKIFCTYRKTLSYICIINPDTGVNINNILWRIY